MSNQLTLDYAKTADDINAVRSLRAKCFWPTRFRENPDLLCDEGEILDEKAHVLMLKDGSRVIGSYRIVTEATIAAAGYSFCAQAFDTSQVEAYAQQHNVRYAELSRACVAPDAPKSAMLYLWSGIGAFIKQHNIGILCGEMSFPGALQERWRERLAGLYTDYVMTQYQVTGAPQARDQRLIVPINHGTEAQVSLRDLPSLCRMYLQLGAKISQDAYRNTQIDTTDVYATVHVHDIPVSFKRRFGVE